MIKKYDALCFDKTGEKYRYRVLNKYERKHLRSIVKDVKQQQILDLIAFFNEYDHPITMTAGEIQEALKKFSERVYN